MKDVKKRLYILGIAAATLLFAAIFVVELVSVVPFSYALTPSNTLTGTVTVPLYCGISLSPNAINFGSVNPGGTETTANDVYDTNAAGNNAVTVWVSGQSWNGPLAAQSNFGVSNTFDSQYSFSGVTGANALSASITYIGENILGGVIGNVYFGLQIPSSQPANVYTTNIVIENSC